MRRSLCTLLLLGCVGVAPIAFAEDVQPDAGPIATASATTPPPPPPPPPTPTSTVTDQEPLQLGRFVELEADRARAKRYGASAFEMVAGGAGIAYGGVMFAIKPSGLDSTTGTFWDALAVVSMVVGGLSIIDGVVSLLVSSPMERMFDLYAPIAIDKSLSASERLHRGEQLLESMANAEHGQRMLNGATSLVLAAVEVGIAIFLGADNDLWGSDNVDRVILSSAVALGAVTSIGDGIGKLVWERGPAEIAWDQWHASHQQIIVQTSRVHFTPLLAPTHGGATAGFSLRF